MLRTGPLATIQDGGRPGWAHVGVTGSGAADRGALRLANRLVGNPQDAAAIETVLGGLALTATDSLALAVTGAHAPATLNGAPVPHAVVLYLTAGDTLALGTPAAGLRSYVAVSGGCVTDEVLGGRSTDTLSGLGPAPLRPGDRVPVGEQPAVETLHPQAPPLHADAEVLVLEVLPGPRSHWLADLDALGGPWRVTDQADRVGVRLAGTPLARRPEFVGVELPSEGVVRGAIQLPGSGQPVVFGPDHPVTGGYPVIGVVTEASCDLLAQARPGQAVVLRPPR
ncbi:biotin-dependent carboxyltransferase family protein [Propioniciclava coleopterorum]|uniref:5-oxoprolinase subunit C family protein n=1 Tax=Propioniciclava coleopterorum TaxID=2714937 RepID=UPI001FE31650|nr:biotin-dependent carboxyltransferase family protein [Propioniciclava coleopterorum]